MSGNLLKSVVIVAGIALGVAVAGVAAQRFEFSRFNPGSDLDAGADEFDAGTPLDFDVSFVNDEESDDDDADDDAVDDADDSDDDA